MASKIPIGNLPVEVTSFVGRRQECADIRRLLSASRLVTVTGMGGVGKTRVSLRAAAGVRRAFRHGVWLVELEHLNDGRLISRVVADVLGISDLSSGSSIASLVDYLASKELLLVLDGCEHLAEDCAVLADDLLRACSDVRVLATSRRLLGAYGEASLQILPLTVPESDQQATEGLEYDSVTLFTERAAAALGEFRLTAQNSEAVASICRRLDGLPAAIELAAVRLRALSVNQLAELLTESYRLLSGGNRNAPERHRALEASIEWSYDLCSSEERRFWSRVCVFSGGFGLDAAEAVCGEGQATEVLVDVVAALVDKSILIREDHNSTVRYRLLEMIRQFGQSRLGDSELEVLREQHREWYAELVARAENGWIGERQQQWLEHLRCEHSNLRVALEYCLMRPSEVYTGLRMAASLHHYWWACGLLSEGRYWLSRIREAAVQSPEADHDLVRAIHAEAWLALMQRDTAAAIPLAQQGETLARRGAQSDDTSLDRALMVQLSGFLALSQGEVYVALERFDESLVTFKSMDQRNRTVETLILATVAGGVAGDVDRAADYHRTYMTITQSMEETWFRGYSLWALGLATWRKGDPDRAASFVAQALRLKYRADDRVGMAVCLETMAWIAATQDEPERAAKLLGSADHLFSPIETSIGALVNFRSYRSECANTIRRALGGRAYLSALHAGQNFTAEDAADYVLGAKKSDETSQQASTTRTSSALTPRENEIALLVAQGMSNREISRSLVISQRTVDVHVEHILAKLGFNSRTQVASWIARRNRDNGDERHP